MHRKGVSRWFINLLVVVNWTCNYCSLNTYARIVGTVKIFNQKMYIQVFSIRPVTNMNEVTYHNLEVLTVHVTATRNKVMHTAFVLISENKSMERKVVF